MIDATVEGEENKQSGNSKRKLTDEEITAHAILFMSAGYDTTATSLSYTSYLLAIHPQIQQKVHEEIDNYYQENPVNVVLYINCMEHHMLSCNGPKKLTSARGCLYIANT